MEAWTTAIADCARQQRLSQRQLDELFDRALFHTTKFKQLHSLVADTNWLIHRFPHFSVDLLVDVLLDADKHRLVSEQLVSHRHRHARKLEDTGKLDLLDLVAQTVRARLGVGNLLRQLIHPGGSCVSGNSRDSRVLLDILVSPAQTACVSALALWADVARADTHSSSSSTLKAEPQAKRRKTLSQAGETAASDVLRDWERRPAGIHVFAAGLSRSAGRAFAVAFPELPQHDFTRRVPETATDADCDQAALDLDLEVLATLAAATRAVELAEENQAVFVYTKTATAVLESPDMSDIVALKQNYPKIQFVHVADADDPCDWRALLCNRVAIQPVSSL